MRTGAACGHSHFLHETAFYGSDDELVDVVVPFVRDGVAAGEPVLVALDDRHQGLIRGALGGEAGVTFLSGADQYARPAATIRTYRALFAELVAQGAAQIRVVGNVPHPGVGFEWREWARYEAAVNRAYDEFPVWGLCPYDTRTTPPEVLADVAATHPFIATPHGEHVHNPHCVDPAEFLTSMPDALDHLGAPDVVLFDPSLAVARGAVGRVADVVGLAGNERRTLVLALSELVTNAVRYGCAPVTVQVWSSEDSVSIAVSDSGRGLTDPFAGLVHRDHGAVQDTTSGYGLWIVHQICDAVAMGRDGDSFTVRATVRRRRAR